MTVKKSAATPAKPVPAKPVAATKVAAKPASKPAASAAAKKVVKPAADPVKAAASKTAPAKPVVAKSVAAPVKPVVAKPTAALAKPAVKPVEAKAKKPAKEKKLKVVRDSFTLPQDDYARIGQLKESCVRLGLHVKKSELLRAGLRLLGELPPDRLKQVMDGIEKVKTGRPKKSA